MHCPHFIQRERKPGSSRAPGGLISCGIWVFTALPFKRIMGTARMPVRKEVTSFLFVRSGDTISPEADTCVLYPMRSCGHGCRQFMHRTHSLVRIFAEGVHAPSQSFSHTRQSGHLSSDFPTRQRAKRPSNPNKAPSGHINLQ